ncbi:MAG: hypothetical protein FWD57_01120 [Polyangiaceae bacterium]|nr:hypothetical protein [Polyangiaceae bacterium]
MSATQRPYLGNYLRSVCDDAVFLLCSTSKVDRDVLNEMVTRRASHYATVVQGEQPDGADWDRWVVSLCVALAPVSSPVWLPMHELIDSLTLEAGARGVRSLFTSKPSKKAVDRARAIGSFSVRALTAVLGAGGSLGDEDQLMRRCVVSSLGLPDEDASVLCQESPLSLDGLDVPPEIDPKVARLVASGVWLAVFREGLDALEDECAVALCGKLKLTGEETELVRRQSREVVDSSRVLWAAVVDAVRYVLSDDDDVARRVSQLVARLALPPVHRGEVESAIEHGAAVVLMRRHVLDRKQLDVCLVLSWLAVLCSNPEQTRLSELMVRHDRLASDYGSKADGASTRMLATAFVHEQLMSAVQAGGL